MNESLTATMKGWSSPSPVARPGPGRNTPRKSMKARFVAFIVQMTLYFYTAVTIPSTSQTIS